MSFSLLRWVFPKHAECILGGGCYMAFIRLDGGGSHLIFATSDRWATVNPLGPSPKLAYSGSYEKVLRTRRNPYTGKWTIRIGERDTQWECESVDNDPIADGSFTNAALFQADVAVVL
jgi:hypothetical protein